MKNTQNARQIFLAGILMPDLYWLLTISVVGYGRRQGETTYGSH